MPELSERTKMLLKLGLLFLAAGLMGLGLYFLFFKKTPSVDPGLQPDTETPGVSVGGLPTGNDGGSSGTGGGTNTGGGGGQLPSSPVANGGRTAVVTLTTSEITAPTITKNGTIAYYDPADGKFYTIDKNGNVTPLSSAKFPEASSITFSEAATDAVVEFPDGSNVIYDFDSSRQVSMPAHWSEFSFNAAGDEVVTKSIANDPSARALVVSSTDGASTKVIAALGSNDDKVDVNWSPDGSVLGFSATGSGGSSFGQNEIYMIGSDGEASAVLLVNGSDFKAVWSPDSKNLLYSVADAGDDYRATLWYGDKNGDRKGTPRKLIGVKTSADKCTFATSAIAYCAVPTTMPAGGGTSPSLISANDNLYRIDLPSGRATLLAIPDVNMQMFDLEVSGTGDALYFTDKTGRLNYLRLK
jgi:dipeptidyl aminopeptidase/acylaminoacyl peptidase